jgi:hypothetical protein
LQETLSAESCASRIYFDLLRKRKRQQINLALDGFTARLKKEPPFWADLRQRITETLTPEGTVEVTVTAQAKHVVWLGPILQKHADHMAAQVDAGDLNLTPPDRSSVFRMDGKSWTISFAGKQISQRDSVGLFYLATLLANPRRSYSPQQLSALRQQSLGISNRNPDGGDDGLSAAIDSYQEISDPEAICEYKRRLQELRSKQEQQDLSEDEKKSVANEINCLKQTIRETEGPRRRLEQFANRPSKERKAVALSFKRLLANLEKAHAPLHRHLRASLEKSPSSYKYAPDPQVEWIL